MIGIGILILMFAIIGMIVTHNSAFLVFAAIGIMALLVGDQEDDDSDGGA